MYDPGFNTYGTRGGGSQTEFIGGPRNGARLPTTQRLDVDVTRSFRVRGTTIAPYLSVVNAYNAKNVFLYVFDYTKSSADTSGDLAIPSPSFGRCHDSFLARRARALMLMALCVAGACELGTSRRSDRPRRASSCTACSTRARRRRSCCSSERSPARSTSPTTSFDSSDPIISAGGIAITGATRRADRLDRQGHAAPWRIGCVNLNGKGSGVYRHSRSPDRRSSSARAISCTSEHRPAKR